MMTRRSLIAAAALSLAGCAVDAAGAQEIGTSRVDLPSAEITSAATDLNFDPLVLPAGIAPSDDPLLSARSATYSQSFTRREGEIKQPSAITAADARRGE
jgi:catalase